MHADRGVEQEVFAAVDAFLGHLAGRRLAAALECFAPDADVALYGSEVGEVVIGPEALRHFLGKLCERPYGPSFTLLRKRASVRASVAWFTAEAEVAIGNQRIEPYRLTGVLEKRQGRWLWMLFAGSEPLPDRA
jgi:hypothetical protein